jgi:hypothetical protein
MLAKSSVVKPAANPPAAKTQKNRTAVKRQQEGSTAFRTDSKRSFLRLSPKTSATCRVRQSGPFQFLTAPRAACKCPRFVESTTLSPARLEAYDFKYDVTTYSLLMSPSVAVPWFPIVIFSSYCKISRILSTPGTPNDPRPPPSHQTKLAKLVVLCR